MHSGQLGGRWPLVKDTRIPKMDINNSPLKCSDIITDLGDWRPGPCLQIGVAPTIPRRHQIPTSHSGSGSASPWGPAAALVDAPDWRRAAAHRRCTPCPQNLVEGECVCVSWSAHDGLLEAAASLQVIRMQAIGGVPDSGVSTSLTGPQSTRSLRACHLSPSCAVCDCVGGECASRRDKFRIDRHTGTHTYTYQDRGCVHH